MSPEQTRGLNVDSRTDIWSLGAVVYEILSGRPAFEGETATDVLVSILEREPAPLSERVTDVPLELQRIVKKALRKNREERYQTIQDMQSDLKQFRQELSPTIQNYSSTTQPGHLTVSFGRLAITLTSREV